MATNLLIGNADIPLAAPTTTFSDTVETGLVIENLFGGNKADLFRNNGATSGDHTLFFDGQTKASNFLFIGKANLLQVAGVNTITLKGSNTNNVATATTVTTLTSFTSATLMGPQAEDYVTSFTTSTGYRYWWVIYNSSGGSRVTHSKLFFGNAFDPGKDPARGFVTLEMARRRGSQRRAFATFAFKWSSLTYSNAVAFHDLCSRPRRYNSFVLYTTSYHGVLNGWKVVYCRLVTFRAPQVITDYNDVEATFEEIL